MAKSQHRLAATARLAVDDPAPVIVLDRASETPRPAAVSAHIRRASAINMIGGLLSQGVKFAVVIYVARSFPPAQFGWFSFAIAVNAFLFVIGHFGLPVYGARAVALTGKIQSDLLVSLCLTRAALALLATGAAVAILWFAPMVSREELLLVAWFGLSNVPVGGLVDWVFQGLHHQDVSAIVNVVWQLLWFLFVALGVRAGASILVVPISLCISALLAAVLAYVWLKSIYGIDHGTVGFRGLWQRSRALLTSGAALGTGTLLITVLIWTDAIIIRLMRGEVAVGLYAAGNRAALALSMLGTFYVQGAFPLLSHASADSRRVFELCFEHTYSVLALLYIPGSLCSIYYAPEIIHLLFHRVDYFAAVPVFRLFQAILPLFVVNTLLGTGVLLAFQKDKEFRNVLLGTVGIFLVLCTALTWRWGAYGAAVAMLIAQAISFSWFYQEARKNASLHLVRNTILPLIAGFSVVAVCWMFHLSWWGGILVLATAYVALFMNLRESVMPETA